MQGNFIVNSGEILHITAGAAGNSGLGGGGGAGSGVYISRSSGTSILIIAGGGGGAATSFSSNGMPGVTGQNGTAGSTEYCSRADLQGGGGGGYTTSGINGGPDEALQINGRIVGGGGGSSGFSGVGGYGNGNGGGGIGGGGGGAAFQSSAALVGGAGGGGGGYTGGIGACGAGGGGGSINNGSNQVNTTGGNAGAGYVTIECLGTAPTMSVNDVSLNEGNTGTATLSFTVTLSEPAGAGGFTFDIATQDNTATTGNNDYVARSLTSQTIPAGNSTYTFDVTVNGDNVFESDETFFVNVTNVSGAAVSDGQGLGTITNDDVSCASYTNNIAYVNAAATGANNGTTWADAFTSLQSALAAANTCPITQIWVAKGTHFPTADATGNHSPANARTKTFVMKNGVAIYGGFAGTEVNLTDRVLNLISTTNKTILSGDIDGTPDVVTGSGSTLSITGNGGNAIHVISNPAGLTTTAVLDGFVITAGNADGSQSNGFGGGVYNKGISGQFCNPSFRNCSFQGNSASFGGAMLNDASSSGHSSPVLTNCSFQGNSASNLGGAMYNNGYTGISSPVLTNCAFVGNSASNRGGAMYNSGGIGVSSPQLTNCSFQGNSASNLGGAVYNDGGFSGTTSLVLTNCVLFGNGGANTFVNEGGNASITATYSLFDNTVTNYSATNSLTVAVSPFASSTSVALTQCSPAINMGNPATTSATVGATDLAGQPRFFASGRIDMGAYEFQGDPSFPASITGGPAASSVVCVGAPVTASVSVSGTVTGYQWYKGSLATPVASQTTATLSIPAAAIADGGSYFVVVTGACNSFTSTAFSLTINASPTAFTLTGGGGSFCAGGSGVAVGLSGSESSVNYQLKRNNVDVGSPVGGTNGAISFGLQTAPGTYTVLATHATTQCPALQTGSATVSTAGTLAFTSTPTVSGVPVCAGTPVTVNFGMSCAGLVTLQLSNASGSFTSPTPLGAWSTGSSVLIPGSVPAGSGYRIRVVATGGGPTSNPSAAFRVRACGTTRLAAETSAEDGAGLQVSVSPNPTEGLLRIGVRGAAGQALTVELFSRSGQVLRQQGIEKAQTEESLSWDISRQPAGLYLLRVSSEYEAKTVKVVR